MSPDINIEFFFSGMVFTIRIYTKRRLAGPLLVWTLRVWPLSVGPLWVRHLWIWHLWVRTRAEPWCWRLAIGSWRRKRRSSWTLAIVGRRHSKGISFGWPIDVVVKRIVLPHYRVDWLVLGHVSFPHWNPDIDRKIERLKCTEKESNSKVNNYISAV